MPLPRPCNMEEIKSKTSSCLQGEGNLPEVHKHAKINSEPYKADICKKTLEIAGAWQKRQHKK